MESKHTEKDLKSSQSAVEDSEEEENEILEESPCGRWHKRREEVEQNNIPGIDATYLAMDTDEGVEVVWNEVRFSERRYFKAKEEIISEVFDRLIQLDHPNIVKLHKYWIHKDADIPKVVFITEYMSSGSLRQYFEKTKRHDIKISLQVWRRWCTQTLSALCYLHSSQPPIIHGNINCDTIFISYNGLIKIGAIAPDAIHRHVKTVRADAKSNLHFVAPELGNCAQDCHALSPAVDIYSFGMCALEMAALEIPTDNDSSHITEEVIQRTIDSLDNPLQRDFIQQCLRKDPATRPSARDLLFHPIIFEVPSLRLFCAHSIINNPSLQPEQLTESLCQQNQLSDRVVAEIRRGSQPPIIFKQSDFPNRELEKLLDEVKNGTYPLTAVMPTTRSPLVSRQRTISPEVVDDAHKLINTPDNPYDEETRRVVYMNCSLQPLPSDTSCYDVKIVIKLDDKINRQLTCEILKDQLIPNTVSQELVYYGFINKDDKDLMAQMLMETLNQESQETGAFCEKSLQQVSTRNAAVMNNNSNSNNGNSHHHHHHHHHHQQQQHNIAQSNHHHVDSAISMHVVPGGQNDTHYRQQQNEQQVPEPMMIDSAPTMSINDGHHSGANVVEQNHHHHHHHHHHHDHHSSNNQEFGKIPSHQQNLMYGNSGGPDQ